MIDLTGKPSAASAMADAMLAVLHDDPDAIERIEYARALLALESLKQAMVGMEALEKVGDLPMSDRGLKFVVWKESTDD